MKKTFLVIMILSMLTILTAGDEIWQKAKVIYLKSKNLVPGKIVSEMKRLDKNDEIKSQSQIIIETSALDGGVVSDFISGNRDGNPITTDDPEVKGALSENYSPDDETFFDRIESKKKVGEETLDGIDCSVFEYSSQKDDKGKEIGKIWIDKEGHTRKREFTMNPKPDKVKDLTVTISYIIKDNVVVADKVEVDTLIKWMLMKFHVVTTKRFSDYWKFE